MDFLGAKVPPVERRLEARWAWALTLTSLPAQKMQDLLADLAPPVQKAPEQQGAAPEQPG